MRNNKHKKIEVKLMFSSSCEICVDELEKSLYTDKYFETYVKNKDWVKGFIQTTTKQKITYTISLKEPVFKIKNNIYYDEDFKKFFMPKKINLPILLIEKDNLKSEVIKQAKLIKKNIENLKSLNYSNLSGWQVTTDKVIVKMGKSDIGERVKLLKKIINNLNQNNLNVVNLDLRYQQGYVLKI
jgi:Cell division protein FtsQ.